MSASHFIFSAICIGVANSFFEWLILGFLFRKTEALTPQIWRPENKTSYLYSILLSFLFGVLFTLFYLKVAAPYVIAGSILSYCKLGLICFACFSFILELGNAIYINYDRKFVVGKMITSCLNYLSAAIIAGLFYWG